jgi:hypothetical protein
MFQSIEGKDNLQRNKSVGTWSTRAEN